MRILDTNYLKEMKRRGLFFLGVYIEMRVMIFLWMNISYFSSQFISGKKVASVSVEEFIEHSVRCSLKGYKGNNSHFYSAIGVLIPGTVGGLSIKWVK